MRPVNLIPPDERRGDSAALRTGSLVYVLVGGLTLLLLGIVAVALTGKQIDDRKAQKASLQQQLRQETARAKSVAAFTSFRAVQEQRAATVTSLAQSRFDWSRVLHELSLVLPSGVTLTDLTGSVSSDAQSSGSASSSSSSSSGGDLRGSIAGPALEITGCAPGQDAVAGFVSALQDIDGVTRVGLSSSQIGGSSSGGGSSSSSSSSASGSDSCNAGPNTADFNITVAFDAVPTPSTATTAPSVPSSVSSSTTSASTDQSGTADAQSQEAVSRTSAKQQVSKGQHAVHAFLGGGG
jgi:Tfp pilus assembly protein PilN